MKITDELLEQYAPAAAEQMMADLPEDADLPRHRFSPEFERNVRRMDKRARPHWQRWLRGTVAAVLACAILGGFFVTPAGAYVYEQVWQFVKIHVVPDETSTVPISFGYLPEGFAKVIEEEISENYWVISFQSEDGRSLDVIQSPINTEGEFYKEIATDGSVETVEIDGITYWIFTEQGEISLYWIQQGSEFIATGTVDRETLLEVAKNISKIN